jgi:drug/metabolite transporter (DMT)-like permease
VTTPNAKRFLPSAPVRGALWMVLSCACFSGMTAAIRPASEGLHSFEVVFFRNAFGLLLLAPIVLRAGLHTLKTTRLDLHLFRAACFLGAMLCWFTAIKGGIPLADAVALNFLAPIFITILAAVALGERVRTRRWMAVAVGFAGALIILRPGAQAITLPAILALADAAIWSVSAVVIRRLSRTDSPLTIVTHMFIWVTPVSFVLALFVWTGPSWTNLFWLSVMSLLSTLGHVALTRSFAAAEASVVIPFDYTRLVFSAALGFLAFGEVPDRWTILGAAVIIGSSLYIARREAQLARNRQADTPS